MFPSPLSLKQFTTFISASCLAVSPFLFNSVFLIMLQCVSHLLFVFSLSVFEIFFYSVFSLHLRYDMPGKDILHWRWSLVGSSLPPCHVSWRGLLQSWLLPVPQHLWSPHTSLQCQRAGGEVLPDVTQPPACCAYSPFASAEEQQPSRPQGEAPVSWQCRSCRQSSLQAAQQTPAHELQQGGASLEGAEDWVSLAWGEGLQHRRSAA